MMGQARSALLSLTYTVTNDFRPPAKGTTNQKTKERTNKMTRLEFLKRCGAVFAAFAAIPIAALARDDDKDKKDDSKKDDDKKKDDDDKKKDDAKKDPPK